MSNHPQGKKAHYKQLGPITKSLDRGRGRGKGRGLVAVGQGHTGVAVHVVLAPANSEVDAIGVGMLTCAAKAGVLQVQLRPATSRTLR